eukprot:444420-Pelagomonas_calceolata.AAC.3
MQHLYRRLTMAGLPTRGPAALLAFEQCCHLPVQGCNFRTGYLLPPGCDVRAPACKGHRYNKVQPGV